ncbi:glycosyltransferase family 39 protein [Lentzea tibetensis]|uniref:Glycosyltransferase family 39 protein n=1 Tax=Lentzea tibetensis TaxID=2591470 RepID=A0A563EEZ7_9PSEU|nr:glycosyltransferase family 39 protein [Lentzea tibetensis]TWP43498.1 glycosyltransferase family 39 protein [Lentzea tibetensis]
MRPWGAVGAVLVVQAAVLTALSGRHGFHRDELYFVAAGKRPDWGYVDQPPITPILARISTGLFGETPSGLRIVAILLAMGTVVVAALIAREFGGGELFTAIATALSAYPLVVSHMLSTSTVDLFVWVVILLFAVKLLKSGDGRWWIPLGVAIAAGIANKWLVLLLVAALGVSVLIAGPRKVLATWWLAAGAGVCLLLSAPVLIWQWQHDFPLLTVAAGISADDGAENRVLFVPMQLIYLSPVLVPVWIAGLVRLWRSEEFRAVALAYPVLCVLTLITGGKPYYSVAMLVALVAAGAQPTLDWLRNHRRAVPFAAVAALIGVVISVVVSLPVLPLKALGPVLAMNKEQGEEIGWPELTASVSQVWQQIPPEQRATAVIFTRNYGQAGAIEEFGAAQGLPKPYSGHMSYADWGPPPDSMTGPVVLVGGVDNSSLLTGCRVVLAHDNGRGIDNDEQGTRISLCAGTTAPWNKIWPDLRRFY